VRAAFATSTCESVIQANRPAPRDRFARPARPAAAVSRVAGSAVLSPARRTGSWSRVLDGIVPAVGAVCAGTLLTC